MALGSTIIVSADPQGKFLEGIITDTSKPGQCVEIVPAVAPVGGRHSLRASSHADGAKGPVIVLLEDDLQGFGMTTAYVSGSRCRAYTPIMGEELNMLLGDVAGTGDSVAIGDLFGVANGGKIKRNSSYASAPFQALEALAALTADTLVWCFYLGNEA